jgi:cyclic beta-1,2-glucan synthetase
VTIESRHRRLRVANDGPRGNRLLTRLDDTRRVLARVHARLTTAVARGTDVGPAGEWLLDNAHVVDEHVRAVRASLPRGYYRELPELAAGRLAGYPRVYGIAWAFVAGDWD